MQELRINLDFIRFLDFSLSGHGLPLNTIAFVIFCLSQPDFCMKGLCCIQVQAEVSFPLVRRE